MPRIRSVKPDFWQKEDLSLVPRDARLLYIGLWNLADEHGRLRGNPSFIKGQLFPYDDDLGVKEIEVLLEDLAELGKLHRYQVVGFPYLFLPKLAKHQRLEPEKVPSKLPGQAAADRSDESAHEANEAERGAASSARGAASSELGEEDHALLYGTGTREQEEDLPSSDEPMKALVDLPGAKPAYKPGSDDDPYWRRFWEAYPRKAGKQNARLRWAQAVKKAHPDLIIERAERYAEQQARDRTPQNKIKMAEGWLNGQRWEDESLTAPASQSPYGGGYSGTTTASEVYG
jgi:hypothetical protein